MGPLSLLRKLWFSVCDECKRKNVIYREGEGKTSEHWPCEMQNTVVTYRRGVHPKKIPLRSTGRMDHKGWQQARTQPKMAYVCGSRSLGDGIRGQENVHGRPEPNG